MLFGFALDKTYAVLKRSFATMPHALGPNTGSDIFHFVVSFLFTVIIFYMLDKNEL